MSHVVIPGDGELSTTARILLDLAEDVTDVRTVGNGTQFEIPEYLAERYHAYISPPARTPRKRAPKKEES